MLNALVNKYATINIRNVVHIKTGNGTKTFAIAPGAGRAGIQCIDNAMHVPCAGS